MRFRPCIDLRGGRVVQIVGGTLVEGREPTTHFESDRSPAFYARMYRRDALPGGHVIALGPGNHDAALTALNAFPGGMQMGGGVTPENAEVYLEAGASHVIVTSYVFRDGRIDMARLEKLATTVGTYRLVLDVSCRQHSGAYWVVTDRWQRFTDVRVDRGTLERLSAYCDEFLVHGVDVEGTRVGIAADLVRLLGDHSPLPVTYAGGAKTLDDLEQVKALGSGRVDLTMASALDIFGGSVPYREVVAWQRREESLWPM
jgi:phosphoribosylformimino-5-aminoimidazole carboxamide ribotide isomerase